MKRKTKLILFSSWLLGLLLIPMIGVSYYQPQADKTAKFVLASWSYPDEYGQGIANIIIYENSTGSWQLFDSSLYTESTTFEWTIGVGIKFRVYSYLNKTLVGASSLEDGKNYFRHNVTVTIPSGSVFSQENFTYAYSYDYYDPIYLYFYEVVLNFLPEASLTYTAVVTYEVFY